MPLARRTRRRSPAAVFRRRAARWSCTARRWPTMGVDPLPGGVRPSEDDGDDSRDPAADALRLVTAASHHFVSSSLASQPGLLQRRGRRRSWRFTRTTPPARGIARRRRGGRRERPRLVSGCGRVVTDAVRPRRAWCRRRAAGPSCPAAATSTGPRPTPSATWRGRARFTATASGCGGRTPTGRDGCAIADRLAAGRRLAFAPHRPRRLDAPPHPFLPQARRQPGRADMPQAGLPGNGRLARTPVKLRA